MAHDRVRQTRSTCFQLVFWAFGAAISAFKFCRPVTCIDDIHLYGKYKGKLLIALVLMGMDSYSHWLSLSQNVNRMTLGRGLWLTWIIRYIYIYIFDDTLNKFNYVTIILNHRSII
ncbi:hypothetical protein CFOL_v3_12170 [Cephalotus follicularis]|uniref:Uncharacterized protein n=1 Tax=Cephalotus follicularis TaxID=3775 RepID=A0A1Q3BKX3_CEPFO|nr:hypothetical protein CFOL_v3_12170 [Cephalotus follicularis]